MASQGMVKTEPGGAPGAPAADTETKPGKLFVGGLSWETTDDSLRKHFGQYGELTDVVVMKDKYSGHPRGFGFVTFRDVAVAETTVMETHTLDGRQVDAKLAVPRDNMGGGNRGPPSGNQAPPPRQDVRTKKVFVGGLSHNVSEEEFKEYFTQYGEVTDSVIMKDHENQSRSRGFGFITFDSEDSVDKVLTITHTIGDKTVEVKKAEPKSQRPGPRDDFDRRGGYGGGMGGMRGGYGGGMGGMRGPPMGYGRSARDYPPPMDRYGPMQGRGGYERDPPASYYGAGGGAGPVGGGYGSYGAGVGAGGGYGGSGAVGGGYGAPYGVGGGDAYGRGAPAAGYDAYGAGGAATAGAAGGYSDPYGRGGAYGGANGSYAAGSYSRDTPAAYASPGYGAGPAGYADPRGNAQAPVGGQAYDRAPVGASGYPAASSYAGGAEGYGHSADVGSGAGGMGMRGMPSGDRQSRSYHPYQS